MTLYSLFALPHAEQNLADAYRVIAKIQEESPLLAEANKKILSALEDIQKVSEGVHQQLEERR